MLHFFCLNLSLYKETVVLRDISIVVQIILFKKVRIIFVSQRLSMPKMPKCTFCLGNNGKIGKTKARTKMEIKSKFATLCSPGKWYLTILD